MSYALSDHHRLFVEAGYPLHDAVQFADGEWAIREFHKPPTVPALTPWTWTLKGIRHQEISLGFIQKQLRALDPTRLEFWEAQVQATLASEADYINRELFVEDAVERTFQRLKRNESLWERIARHGPGELDLRTLAARVAADSGLKARQLGIRVKA